VKSQQVNQDGKSTMNDVRPKRVGIVFVEDETNSKLRSFLDIRTNKIKLDFDQLAFAHLLLQLNNNQSLFDFQIVSPSRLTGFPLPKSGKDVLDWFVKRVQDFENSQIGKAYGIDYWLSITSFELNQVSICSGKTESGKLVWVITSFNWERQNCPPSVFEYLVSIVVMCSLNTLSAYYGIDLHNPDVVSVSGCIFENTPLEKYRRISVSNPLLCFACKQQLLALDDAIKQRTGTKTSVNKEIDKILSRKWMGSPEERDSPLYNINKNYGYNVDSHSGFYKKKWEIIRDSIVERTAEWIVGGIIGVATLLLGHLLLSISNLKP
jgi:hypothetical protein